MGEGGVVVERGLDYGLGKLADVYLPDGDTPAPLALLWHGIGVDERDVGRRSHPSGHRRRRRPVTSR